MNTIHILFGFWIYIFALHPNFLKCKVQSFGPATTITLDIVRLSLKPKQTSLRQIVVNDQITVYCLSELHVI